MDVRAPAALASSTAGSTQRRRRWRGEAGGGGRTEDGWPGQGQGGQGGGGKRVRGWAGLTAAVVLPQTARARRALLGLPASATDAECAATEVRSR